MEYSTGVDDTFISNASLKLLTVSISILSFGFGALYTNGRRNRETISAHLQPFSSSNTALVSHFPCAELPTDPAMRFVDLFFTCERWKARAEDIKPYLSDIVVDTKDLDKLLLKYARALTDKYG